VKKIFDDHTYNLMMQITQEQKSLWRIKNIYKNNAGNCPDCVQFWEKLEKEKESQVEELRSLLKKHLAQD